MRNLGRKLQEKINNTLYDVRLAFRGVLNLVKSADNIQKVQVSGLAEETLQDVEFMQQFGFTSVPPAGTQVVVLPVGGKTTHSIVIATENGSFRVKNLQGGEVAVYDQSGSTIILKQGRLIEVDCDVFKLTCKSYQLNCQTYQTSASSSADFTTPKLETSAIFTAQGVINGNGGMAISGGSGASFNGNISQTGGSYTTDSDVIASGISLTGHTHPSDSGGSTGGPQ
ncbi:phage baseplate assembly protein V [[Haemophilus] felis]|uniref:Baseplate assembly protein n=1 Tax=[Haemophilus] felis TaxID=123822 RepID=A0A1T0BAB7_9PAST|nr:phage baseplate assembly protein V [[Haemophilus] felis]NBI40345.1 phage baseplate assembly protein V [[Haemophilus] felis]OOS07077.1 baseplate assembly protein [[Haemophilus] felis]